MWLGGMTVASSGGMKGVGFSRDQMVMQWSEVLDHEEPAVQE